MSRKPVPREWPDSIPRVEASSTPSSTQYGECRETVPLWFSGQFPRIADFDVLELEPSKVSTMVPLGPTVSLARARSGWNETCLCLTDLFDG